MFRAIAFSSVNVLDFVTTASLPEESQFFMPP